MLKVNIVDTVLFSKLPEAGSKNLEVRTFEQTNEECRSFCSDFAVRLFCILSSLLAPPRLRVAASAEQGLGGLGGSTREREGNPESFFQLF